VDVTLSEAVNGARLSIGTRDKVVVRLTENSSGGYRWTVTSVDPSCLELVEHRYEPARAGVGSAGASIWTFTPKGEGRTRLELKKLRSWNPSDPAAERFAVDLDIGGE
jgi:predicted secreted protein